MTDERPNAWRHTIRGRTLIAAGLLALWATAIEARLVYLQVLRHDDILAMADRQQKRATRQAKSGAAPAKRKSKSSASRGGASNVHPKASGEERASKSPSSAARSPKPRTRR